MTKEELKITIKKDLKRALKADFRSILAHMMIKEPETKTTSFGLIATKEVMYRIKEIKCRIYLSQGKFIFINRFGNQIHQETAQRQFINYWINEWNNHNK